MEQRPYMLLLANHGGLQSDRKSGMMNLVDGKFYLESNGIKQWLSYTKNMPQAVSSIQFLHCYANHTAHPLVVNLEKEIVDEEHLPVIIVQSDFFETSFGSSQDPTPYRNYLTIQAHTPLLLRDYYAAHRQPL